MKNRIQESISVLSYPKEFNGIKLSFLQDEQKTTEDYNNFERIPSWFWLGPTYVNLPLNKSYRKRLCYSLLDFNHKELCRIESFHIPNEECKCKFCLVAFSQKLAQARTMMVFSHWGSNLLYRYHLAEMRV